MQKMYFCSEVAEGVNEAKLTHRNPIGEWITEDSTHTHTHTLKALLLCDLIFS